jgi:hypothetical protein
MPTIRTTTLYLSCRRPGRGEVSAVQGVPSSQPGEIAHFSEFSDVFYRPAESDPAASSVSQPLVLWVWCLLYQSNKSARGSLFGWSTKSGVHAR